jgi:Na+-transporting methylmalonyl-CoA/oxaloacetate decarboxylase gamma subunit
MLLALQITAIGMGLVFGSIILFWLVMAILVRFTAESGKVGAVFPDKVGAVFPDMEPAQGETGPQESQTGHDLKRRAAAIAVAVALARQSAKGPRTSPSPPGAQVSAWQAVQRANRLRMRQRGPVQ